MSLHTLTALQEITVEATIGYNGPSPRPLSRTGQSQGNQSIAMDKSERFNLKKGETRDDILILESVKTSDREYSIYEMPNLDANGFAQIAGVITLQVRQ